jgi:ferredoxin-NADP reductase
MEVGTEVELDAPYGSFTLHNDAEKPAVILAGGIGITPFYSIVKNATHNKLPHQIYLFYSNRRPEDTAFLAELTELAKENPNFHLIATMTEMDKSGQKWEGETGYIDANMVKKYVTDLTTPIYYLAGPASMVAAMRKLLTEMNVNEDNIRTEEFAGY